ncbi:MAG: SDR family NAD(P)-dependent oxidoreductase [Pseudonocardiaceae bacterium]|nr:SDR family NAD(P)-dependent oxidoreductase [Pseudonocardiaceae bacterium]
MSEPVMMITGASRGIGAATARMAHASGYRIAATARSRDRLTPIVEELGGDAVLPIACDVTEWDQLTAAVRNIEESFGGLDVVFANAGALVNTSFRETSETPDVAAWRDMILTNVYGVAITARATLPALIRRQGHLVITGSVAGTGVRPGNLYSATKWATSALAANIRADLVGTGVRVTIVQPGIVDTDMPGPELRAKPMIAADDIARAVLYAVRQPAHVDVNELVVRPTGQDADR